MRIALDASALAKRYIQEDGSQRVGQLCAQAEEVILSVVSIAEIISAFNRRRREKRLTARQYTTLKKDLAADANQATVLSITSPVLKKAIVALEKSPLRALDAIGVATALDTSCDLFVSADARQCTAARALGLHVEQI